MFSYHLLIEILIGLFEGRLKSASRGNGYYFEDHEIESQMKVAEHYFEGMLRHLPEPEKGELCWSENLQIALAMFFHGEATKSGTFNKYALDYALHILPHLDWNAIYSGDEKDRLPRRSRIMKAFQYVKGFYEEHHLFLIRESDMADEMEDEKEAKEDVG